MRHDKFGVGVDAPTAFRHRLIDAIPRLRRYARSLEHNDAACDDLVQQTLERALAHWSQFDPQRDLVVWLLAIAHNACMDALRRDSRFSVTDPQQMQLAQDERSLSQGDAPDPGLRLDLQAALASLSPDMRECLLLVCLEQLSYAEVAEVLKLPIGTVLSRVCRARVLLRDFLAGRAPGRPAPGTPSLRRVV